MCGYAHTELHSTRELQQTEGRKAWAIRHESGLELPASASLSRGADAP